MGHARGKQAINVGKSDGLLLKRKRGNANEVASNGSQTNSLQPKVTGQNKMSGSSTATHSILHKTVDGQSLSQANNCDKVVTQVLDQMLTQNSDKPLISRQDIVSLAQEIVYVISGDCQLQRTPDGKNHWIHQVMNVTTTTTTIVPPQDTTSLNSLVSIPQETPNSWQLCFPDIWAFPALGQIPPPQSLHNIADLQGREPLLSYI